MPVDNLNLLMGTRSGKRSRATAGATQAPFQRSVVFCAEAQAVQMIEQDIEKRFAEAVTELASRVEAAGIDVEDDNTDAEARHWLDGADASLDWSGAHITSDEWFFITTLYGTMTLDGQRTHIRKFFPLFVQQAARNTRNFTPALVADWRLRQPLMKTRLCRMAERAS
jgi:hypothetical protein